VRASRPFEKGRNGKKRREEDGEQNEHNRLSGSGMTVAGKSKSGEGFFPSPMHGNLSLPAERKE